MKTYLRKIDLDMGRLEYDMYQEIPKEETGSENDANGLSFDEFKLFLDKKINDEWQVLTDEFTPKITYIMYSDDYPVGEISIRPKLNDYWAEHSGNIGYKIRPSERKKGYGTRMLGLGLRECLKLGLSEALMQCNEKNYGSMKVIANNGGELIVKDEDTNYYKIKLNKNS
jgi:predicted acetyltransferase